MELNNNRKCLIEELCLSHVSYTHKNAYKENLIVTRSIHHKHY